MNPSHAARAEQAYAYSARVGVEIVFLAHVANDLEVLAAGDRPTTADEILPLETVAETIKAWRPL